MVPRCWGPIQKRQQLFGTGKWKFVFNNVRRSTDSQSKLSPLDDDWSVGMIISIINYIGCGPGEGMEQCRQLSVPPSPLSSQFGWLDCIFFAWANLRKKPKVNQTKLARVEDEIWKRCGCGSFNRDGAEAALCAIENYLIINNQRLLKVGRAVQGMSQETKEMLFKRSHL